VRRVHERDTTLDLPAITLDLIGRLHALEARLNGVQADLHASKGEVSDRDQRLERTQLAVTRQGAMIEILRERMDADRATHRLAQTALDAFDSGAVVIPDHVAT